MSYKYISLTKAPTVTIKPVDGVPPFRSATTVAILTDVVANIEITDDGTEYDSTVEVKICRPAKSGGTQAISKATVENGKIIELKSFNNHL